MPLLGIDFKANKSKRYWKVMFAMFAATIILETIIFAILFFVLPSTPISAFEKVSALPVKYLALILIGGFSKDFLLGVFTLNAYMEWKK